jgi:putative FmdB family regulatory protein
MPLYEYQCQKCGERSEILQKFSDPPAAHCPKCGADNLKKLFSSPAIQFKGSGFYKTDYASKSSTPASSSSSGETKAETKSEPAGDTKSETKTESKSESKVETKSESKSESKSD